MEHCNSKSCNNSRTASSHHNKGVICDVRSCAYHDGNNYCTAEKIAVGPSSAVSSTDTVCATFRHKDQKL